MASKHNTNVDVDSDMSICIAEEENTPPNFVTQRLQRRENRDPSNETMSEHFNDFKEEMRKLVTFFITSQKKELSDINLTLKEIKESNQSIQSSIAYLTDQNEDLKKKIALMENHIKEDRQYIGFLEEKLEDLQIGGRKSNFELKNVPRKDNENKQDLIDMVLCLSETIDCKINRSDIKDIYRLKGKKPEQKNTPIIVETASALLKADVLRMTKSFNIRNKTKLCAKHLGFKTSEDTPVFLSEHLTPKGSRLHFLARDLVKSRSYRFCWTSYGKIYVRKTEESAVILIKSEEQIHKLLSQD